MSKNFTSAVSISDRFFRCALHVLRLSFLITAILLLGTRSQAQVLLAQSFDGATFAPTGWTVNGTGVNTNFPTQLGWVRVPGGTTTATPPYNNTAGPHSGAGMAFYNAWDISAGGVSNLITPALNFASPSGTKKISFWLYQNNGQVATDSVVVLINSTASVAGATRLFGVAPSANATTSQWQQYTVTVPSTFNTASRYIIFQAQSNYQTDIFLDDIEISNLTDCGGAASVTLSSSVQSTCPASPFTLTAATGLFSGFTFQFQVSTNGGTTWTNLGSATTSTTYTVSTQSAASQYRVIATCPSGGSFTSAPISVSQNSNSSCYCTPSSTSTAYYIDDFNTSGGLTNISNLSSGQSPNGYGQFLTQVVSQVQTQSVNFNLVYGSGTHGCGIWVDWNQNGNFNDPGEKVYSSTSRATSHSGSFSVPASATLGNTRMRVVTDYLATTPTNPCSTTSIYAEYEDYTFTVVPLTPCSGTFTATLNGSSTAVCPSTPFTLTASPSGQSGLTYQFQSSTNGGTTWANLGTASTNAIYTISSQTVATQYRVIVACGTGTNRDTSAVVSVAQNPSNACYCNPSSTSTSYYINNFSTTGGVANISNLNSGQSPNGYGAFLTQVVSQLPQQSVSFTASFGSGSYGLAVYVDWNQNGSFSDPGERVYVTSSYVTSTSGSFTVPIAAVAGNTRMRVVADYLNSAPSNPCQTTSAYAEYEDYTFNVIALTACTGTPTATLTSSMSSACSNLPFTLTAGPIGQSGLTYQFQSSTNGGTTWTNLGTASASPTYTVSAQTVATQYRVIVACGTNSNTSAVVSVAQTPPNGCYCVPSSTSTSYYINNFSTTGGFTNISNLNSGQSPNGYGAFLTQVVSQNPGNSVSFNMSFGSGTYGGAIFIDWNQNGIFELSERVFGSNTYASSYSGSFTVPAIAVPGNTRMRVVADYLNTSPSNPCQTTSAYAEYEDYTFNVIALTPCTGTPTATLTSSMSSACSNLPFTLTAGPIGQSGLTYQFQSSTNGGTTWTNLGTASASPTYTVSAQTVATQYRVIVACGTNSNTSAVVSVAQTPPSGCYCIPSGGSSSYYINNFTTTGGITNISNLNSGFSVGGYGAFLSQIVTQFPGQRIDFTAVFGSGTYGLGVWVDWNQNGNFNDPGEKVFTTSSYSSSHSGFFNIPTTAIAGPIRMRVGSAYSPSTGPASPCTGTSYTEFEDYTLQVVPLTPCSGPPSIGTIVSSVTNICAGDTLTLSIPNATFDTGIVFRWEYRINGGLWQTRGISDLRYFGDRPDTTTEYRVVARCKATNDSTISAIYTVNITPTALPYFEDFEGIAANNDLPPCMKATALGTINLTYTSPQSTYQRKNHTPNGSKFASFKYNTTTEQYFFTPGIPMKKFITYKISYWYVTDGNGGNNGNIVSTRTTIGATPTVAGVTRTLGTVTNPTDTNYQQAVYYYTPQGDSTLFIGFGNIATTSAAYFTIDDISIEELPPCTGRPTAGTVVANTAVNCPGSQVELSATGSTAASYLYYQWLKNSNVITGPLAQNSTYLTPPLTTTVDTFRMVLTCISSVTGVQHDTTAPFVLTPYKVTVPYTETFEGITRNNELPTCFNVTDLTVGTATFASGGGGSNHTPGGSKYAAFIGKSLDEWMFTPMMTLQGGKTYRFSFWYRTSSGAAAPILQGTVGGGPSTPQQVIPLGALFNVGNTTYQQYSAVYTPNVTGDFSFGINTTTSSGTSVMSIDDIGVEELPPCVGKPVVNITPTTVNLCPIDSFTLTAPLPSASGLVYEWQFSPDTTFSPLLNPPGIINRHYYTSGAPTFSRYYRLRVICTITNDTSYSNKVLVNVNSTVYAPLPYLNDLENWVNNCAVRDVPTGGNWLQQIRTGNASWRRNDDGSSAGWTNQNAGGYTPQARSGLYSGRLHSTKMPVSATPGGINEGKLDMHLNCNTGAGTSPNKALYFYHISQGAPVNTLDVRLSVNGGATWSTIATFDSAADWRLRRIPFASVGPATIIRFAGRRTGAPANYDIGIDSIYVAPPCTGQPVAGILGAISPQQICPGDSAIVNLNGTYTSQTAGPAGGGYTWNSGQLMQTTWIRAKVTCGGTSQFSYSDTLVYTVSVTPPVAYASLPYTENFENWTDRCALQEIPSDNWANVPAFGNKSWRRNDQGATAAWTNVLGGQWWPGTPAAAIDSFSARFHNAEAKPTGSRGALNLYVDCSGPGNKELRFFVNMSDRTAGNRDSLRIRYSTDGGFTFTRLDSIRRTTGWEQRVYNLPSSAAQTIIRFEAVSDSAQKDIGLDYVQVLNPCSGTPTAGTVDSVGKVCPGRTFMLTSTGTSQRGGLTYVWESSASGLPGSFLPHPGGNTQFLTTSINRNTWFRLGVSCATGTVDYTPARLVEIADTFYCYCQTNPQYPVVTAQFKENIGKVVLKTNADITMMTNGQGTPIINNSTAINAYTNFQNLTPTVMHRDSTYKLEVQQISYSGNASATVVAWIDFNRDGVFDTSERIVNMNTTGPAYNAIGSFTVPSNAKPGLAGMRVTLQQPGTNPPPAPCGMYTGFGETEDYLVELRYAPCSGFPVLNSGMAHISDTAICPGYPVTLWDTGYQQEVYGVTRQWQQSTNNGASWQNVGAPNRDTIDAIVTSPTRYRFVMQCSNGVESYSNVVAVNLLPATACYCPSYATGGPNGDKDSSDIGSVSINNYVFQVGGPHLLNPLATRKWTNYAAAGGVIELWADSTYDLDIYHIMRGNVHKDAKVTVFLDYNQNLTFDMTPQAGYPAERLLTAYTTASNYYLDNLQIRIPAQQILPNSPTLMRVILNENTGPNAASDQGCGTYESGETEDFYVVFRCPTCPTGVPTVGEDNISMFSLFPNPTTGVAKVNLTTRTAVKEIEMTITNMTGQVLKKETFSQPGTQFTTSVDLKEQPRGVYFVEIKADNERIVRKLVVQ